MKVNKIKVENSSIIITMTVKEHKGKIALVQSWDNTNAEACFWNFQCKIPKRYYPQIVQFLNGKNFQRKLRRSAHAQKKSNNLIGLEIV